MIRVRFGVLSLMCNTCVVLNSISIYYIPLKSKFKNIFVYASYIIVNEVCVQFRGREIRNSIFNILLLNQDISFDICVENLITHTCTQHPYGGNCVSDL